MPRGRSLVLVLALLLAIAPSADAQKLSDGATHFSFGVRGRTCWSDDDHIAPDDCPCGPGVAHATVSLTGGRVTAFRMNVRRAGTPAPDHGTSGQELGRIAAPAAAELLFGLAARGGPEGEELIAAAAIADTVVTWPRLLELARNQKLEGDARRAAVFWLSQAAGEAATRGLDSIIADPTGDRDVREHAVFALSQRPREEAVPALIRIARGHGDPSIRRKAVFWLGQTDDERAVALFEDLLRR